MKKTIIYIIVLLLLLSAAGCAGKLPPNTANPEINLAGADIGIVDKSSSSVFTEGIENVRGYPSADALLLDLKNSAVDYVVMEESTAKAAMKQIRGLKIQSDYIKARLSFVVARENPDLRDAINAALVQLDDNGVLKSITGNYFDGKSYQYVSPAGIDRSKGTLTLAVDGKLQPYAYDDGTGKIVGFDVDVARAVCDILGVDMKVTVINRAELLKTVQFGKADFALGCIYENDKNKGLVDFSSPYMDCTQVIVVRR